INGANSARSLAALNAISGDTLFTTDPSGGYVSTIAYDSNYFYLGGSFRSLFGVQRTNLSAVDLRYWAAAPSNLQATAQPCASAIHLTWADQSLGRLATEISRKPSGSADDQYASLGVVPAGVTQFDDQPGDMLPHTYRARATIGASFTMPSNEATGTVAA